MNQHTTISVYDYNRVKLCDLYDSSIKAHGQAYDPVYTKEINGWKTLAFVLPYSSNGEENFRWDYIKNERLIRYTEGDLVEWFLINAPKKRHDSKNIDISFTCDHISASLKTKNLYLVFDDENGIDTIENLAAKILLGTGWELGECDKFYESDGTTEKVRSLISDGKLGAYQQIQNLCNLFCGYPEFDGDKKLVHLRCLNRRNPQMEQTIGKNLSSVEQTPDTSNIVTRLYVEGEYTEDGYVGIDTVNPTGLSFLLNFDYYKEIGMFKDEHQQALDAYVHDVAEIKTTIMDIMSAKNEIDNQLNTLWGQLDFVLFVLENGVISRTIYGGDAAAGSETFKSGDVVAVQHADNTYSLQTVGDDAAVSFAETDLYMIKYITRAAGEIGAKEVSIEAKEKVIVGLEKDLQKDYITEAKRENILQQIAETETAIQTIYEGGEAAEGLYEQVFDAVELALASTDKQNEYLAACDEQDLIEFRFVEAMGDMLRDGYWNDPNYIVGQEKNLYTDALDVMEDLAKPSMAYVISVVQLQGLVGSVAEKFDLNTSIRLYDEELGINDLLYVSKYIHHPDDRKKDAIEISNEYINVQGKTFESVVSRITQLADLLKVKKTIYDRANAIGASGSIPAMRLEGTVDMMKAQLSSVISNWYTDENGNIIFLSVDGQSAMQLCGEGFMIADGKLEDGSWNWRTFGTGKGFTADAIVTGYLSADRIEAGSITATKLDGTVGAMIDLSDNESIKMIVESSGIYRSDTAPENPEENQLWLDTSGQNDVLKRWTGEAWAESTITQSELDLLYAELDSSRSQITQMSNEISSKVSAEVFNEGQAGKADTGWVSAELETAMTQTAEDFTLQISLSEKRTGESIESLNDFRSEVKTYQNFSEDGLELGKSSSPFIARQDNTKLSFLQDNAEVAYISNNSMYITQARVTEKLSIGTEENGYFDWITTSAGLGLKWRGPV